MQADMIVKLCNMYQTKINPDLMQKLLMDDTRLIKYIIDNKIELAKLGKYFYIPLFNDYDYETQIMIFQNDKGQFEKMFEFLKSYEPKNTKEVLKSIYNCKETKNVELAIKYLNSISNIIPFTDIKTIFEILLKCKYYYNCSAVYDVASDNDIKTSGHLIELAKIVANAKNPKAARIVATDMDVKQSKYALELTKIVASAKNPEAALNVATNEYVIQSKYALELTKIVASAKNPEAAWYVATDENVIQREYALELTKMVASAKNPQAARDVATDENVIQSKYVLELTKIVANAKNPEAARGVATNGYVIQSKYALELTKIVASAKNEEVWYVAYNLIDLKCEYVVELTRIIANAKNGSEACIVARNFKKFQSETAMELTKIVANAKTVKNAKFTRDIILNNHVIKSNKIIEIATIFANTNPNNLQGLYRLVISGFLEVLISLMDIFKSKINPNNFDAVIDLLVTGNYELSKNPTESLGKILRSTNNYEKFDELYAYSDESAIKGALELDKEFPGIDIKGNTYVKISKINKKNNN